jgi:hypothetical protein
MANAFDYNDHELACKMTGYTGNNSVASGL